MHLSSQIIWYYLLFINIVTFVIYGWDKKQARKRAWRISELGLLFLALVGGSVASLAAQFYFRHKLNKASFQSKFWIVVFFQIGWLVYRL